MPKSYCGRHRRHYWGEYCPDCTKETEETDRQNLQNTADQIKETMESILNSQIDASDLADQINNPGRYDHKPGCGFRTLNYRSNVCFKCGREIPNEFWDEVDRLEEELEKKKKAEAEAKARAAKETQLKKEREEKEARQKIEQENGGRFGCICVVVIMALLITWVSGGFKNKNPQSTETLVKPPTQNLEVPRQTPSETYVPENIPSESSTEPAPSLPESFFTLGSTIEEVKSIQGTPTHPTFWYENANTTYLAYGPDGSAEVWFFMGRVSGWISYPRSRLKAKIIPSSPVDENLKFFTIGSTMDEVLYVQGQPYTVKVEEDMLPTKEERESGSQTIKTTWQYGFNSTVIFRNGKVSRWTQDDELLHWNSTGRVVLKTKIVPKGSVDENLEYFTIGSTRDEVLVVQGQPDDPFSEIWHYGKSEVHFSQFLDGMHDKVYTWKSSPLNPLKARVPYKPSTDPNLKYFTVGSTMEEVLALQGQPDSIDRSPTNQLVYPEQWFYGPSYVVFKNKRVVNWVERAFQAPLKAKPANSNLNP